MWLESAYGKVLMLFVWPLRLILTHTHFISTGASPSCSQDALRRNFAECASILERHGARPSESTAASHRGSITNGNDGDEEIGIDPNLLIDFQELDMIERIGSGAFGEIYKCRWRGILVAAKCIKSTKILKEWQQQKESVRKASMDGIAENGTGDALGVSRSRIDAANSDGMDEEEIAMALADFRQEVSILRKLRHPNVCMLLAYSTTENFEVMVSELMKCSLLDVFKANILHNTAMPKRKQVVYAQQLAQGMNYLHTCKPPIIHRDLKVSCCYVLVHVFCGRGFHRTFCGSCLAHYPPHAFFHLYLLFCTIPKAGESLD